MQGGCERSGRSLLASGACRRRCGQTLTDASRTTCSDGPTRSGAGIGLRHVRAGSTRLSIVESDRTVDHGLGDVFQGLTVRRGSLSDQGDGVGKSAAGLFCNHADRLIDEVAVLPGWVVGHVPILGLRRWRL